MILKFCVVILIFLEFWDLGEMCSVGFSLVFEFLFSWGILLSRVSFPFGQNKTKQTNNNKNNPESGGQRGWDLGFPALHRHHSGTKRKDTQNGKRCGN